MSAKPEASPVALVVPCYNERGRLDVSRFGDAAEKSDLHILFVDDGSSDGTGEFLERQLAGNPRLSVLRCASNRGKAAAVREGMLALLERCPQADWLGFWDADLSSPLNEVPRMLKFHDLEGAGFDAIWASRVMRAGSEVERPGRRHLFGRMFATASGLLLGVRAYDTQCGAKVFRRSAVAEIFGEPFISRWIFDVEIYCRMGHARILEYPVKEWRDVPGSKVRIGREMFRVGGDLLRIRKVYGRAEGWRISSSQSTVASSQLKNTKPNA
jgi:glycosyltransferase involved in cell wall biosynthesis